MSTSPLKIEYVAVATLTPYARNARTHSAAQVEQIAASITAFGFTNPLLVDETLTLIAGHGRLAAARLVGMAEVPIIRLVGLTDDQKRALVLADNKLALNAGWDNETLVAELRGLGDYQGIVGFSNDELLWLLKGHGGQTDPEDAPPLPETPVTRRGELILLGPHRLVCGDCTDPAAVALALGEHAPRLMVTDPPYGVDYDPAWRGDANKWKGAKVKFGAKALGRVSNDDCADWTEAWKLFRGDVAYVWHGGLRSVEQAVSLGAADFVVRAQIIWNKQSIVVGRGDYHWQHEACWYVVRNGAKGHWNGSRTESTVWDIPKQRASETGHSTQKPVECMKRPLLTNSLAGDAVYDPFVGSGTTIIAAEMVDRIVCALDVDPAYCDVTVARWEAFTGRKAERIAPRAADAA